MKTAYLGSAALIALCPAAASALGLDRSGQNVDILFEDGNVVELSFGTVDPSITGTDLAVFGGRDTGDVGNSFEQYSLGLKLELTPQASIAVILDQPYGADIQYDDTESVALGGTRAEVDSQAATLLARYKFNDNFSVHGGLRIQHLNPSVRLQGAAYGGLSGYEPGFEDDTELGFVVGAAYERPEIALRLAVTYFSAIDHDLETSESINGVPSNLINPLLPATSTTEVTTPQAVNIDFQTGIAPGTLLFANARWAEYSETIVSPVFFDAVVDPTVEQSSITSIEDNFTLSVGVGRQFTDRFAASVAVGYEPDESDDLISPLSSVNGRTSLTIGASYDVTEALTVSGGVTYVNFNDALAETGTPDTVRAEFEDNDAFGAGLRIAYRF